MAYTTINKHTQYFVTRVWSSTGQAQSITNMDFQPDFIWWKERSSSSHHNITDAVRGVSKQIYPNRTNGETSYSGSEISAFNSDGFSIGTSSDTNQNGQTYSYSVNTVSGISIIKYTGNNTAGHTIPHHLGVAPKMVMIKQLTTGNYNWCVGHINLSDGFKNNLKLNSNDAEGVSNASFNQTNPSSTVITLGDDGSVNAPSQDYILYAFAEKVGYSCISYYTGNGMADGSFCYTGHKPAFLLIKNIDQSEQWMMYDNKRLGYNDANNYLSSSTNNSESTGYGDNNAIDVLSNGFKMRGAGHGSNRANYKYVFMSIGQSLVGSNNVTCTAR